MRAATRMTVVFVVAIFALSPLPAAPQSRPVSTPAGSQVSPPPAAPVYTPPLRGAPGGRIGGGTRGVGGEDLRVSVLAPDDRALTVSEQPTLYWFVSRAPRLPVEITLVDTGAVDPILEVRLPPTVDGGIQAVRLADHGVRLKVGVPYKWYVAVVTDPNRRSRDVLAGGTVERIEPPAILVAQLAQAGRDDHPAVYAAAGLWYDALGAISELVSATPNEAGPRRQRAALLTQVGLPAAIAP
jgi:hypothetical protein